MLRKIKNLLYWLPVIWRDEPWDYDYLIKIIRHKLLADSRYYEKSKVLLNGPRKAKEMRVVAEHLERASSNTKADMGRPETLPADSWVLKYLDIKAENWRSPKHQESVIAWHWGEAWRKITRLGRHWWE